MLGKDCFEGNRDKHIKSNPFWTGRHIAVLTAMVELGERWDLARCDAVPIREEGILPLLEKAVD